MADEDKDQKTEDATAKRTAEAFRRGNFAKAPEIQVAFGMLAAFFVLLFYGSKAGFIIRDIAYRFFSRVGEIEITPDNAADWLNYLITQGFTLLTPIIIPCTVASILGGGLQSGFKLTTEVLEWKLDRLDPVKGLQNLFSKQKLKDFLIEFMKFMAVLFIISNGIILLLKDPIFHHPVTAIYTLQFIYKMILVIFIRLVVAIAIIAAINYMFQMQKTKEDLKMTKQEVKDERKNQEGDPMVKSRQRALARSLIQQQMMQAVPEADVIVTNPTHFAIALKYERGKDDAPMILAKGQNLFAQKIKAIAKENGVPMVENKPVAQMLYKMGSVGSTIPYELYQIVAEILAQVYKTHRYYFHELEQRRKTKNADTSSKNK